MNPRYMDGERLNTADEKAVVENLLAYHPHAEDKIGCGLDSIMVKMQLINPYFCETAMVYLVLFMIIC